MGIKEYFIKEIYKDYILCSLPFMAIIPVFVLQIACSNYGWQAFLYIYALFIFIGITLIRVYVNSYKKYKVGLSLFSKEELEKINTEAKTVYNMGKILITNDVIIFF